MNYIIAYFFAVVNTIFVIYRQKYTANNKESLYKTAKM